MKEALRVAWYRQRASVKRRLGDYVSLVILLALVGGLALGSLAGARRTDSSYSTYVASTNPSNLRVFTGADAPQLGSPSGFDERVNRAVARLPLVTRVAEAVIFNGNLGTPTGDHPHFTAGETPPEIAGGNEYLSMDRVTLVAGRLASPKRPDEAVMNQQAALELGLHVGSVIKIPFYSDAEEASSSYNGPPHYVATVKMVGLVVFPSTVVEDDIDELGSGVVLLSSALTQRLATCCATYSGLAVQVRGGADNVVRARTEIVRVDPLSKLAIGGGRSASSEATSAIRSIRPEAVALGVFGAIAALAALMIAALLIARLLSANTNELRTLRAIGSNRRMLLFDSLGGLVVALLGGSLIASVVAFALSPLAPLGPVRPVYPHPGLSIDWLVLGTGALLLFVVLLAIAWALAQRELRRVASNAGAERRPRPSPIVRSLVGSGLTISVVTGVRFALDSGRDRNGAPVRSVMLGSVLAVLVLVATVTFGASLDLLLSRPALYGWNWNYAMLSGYAGQEDLPQHAIANLLDKDGDIEAWSGVNFVSASLDGQHMETMAQRPGAAVGPSLLTGHGLTASNQVVLGTATLNALHKRLGDTVTFDNGKSAPTSLVIVGTATLTPIAKGLEMGSGALVATSDFPTELLNEQGEPIPGPNAILVRIKPGVTAAAAYASLHHVAQTIEHLRGDPGTAGGVVRYLRPAEIVNYRSMGTTPTILGAGLAGGAVAALGLTLVATVRRRRREFAILKTLGFTRRQLATVVSSQSTVVVGLGAVVGVPLGVMLGRTLWILFARDIDAVPVTRVPGVTITLIVVAALVLANAVAALPARMAARTSTGLMLRDE